MVNLCKREEDAVSAHSYAKASYFFLKPLKVAVGAHCIFYTSAYSLQLMVKSKRK